MKKLFVCFLQLLLVEIEYVTSAILSTCQGLICHVTNSHTTYKDLGGPNSQKSLDLKKRLSGAVEKSSVSVTGGIKFFCWYPYQIKTSGVPRVQMTVMPVCHSNSSTM